MVPSVTVVAVVYPFFNHHPNKMKPFAVAIAGAAVLLLCLGNPKQPKRQTLSLKKNVISFSLNNLVRK